jgi:hypothetical protein
MILILLCVFVSGCAPGLPPPEESISSPESGGQSVENPVDLGEPAVDTGSYYFYEDGILNVRLLSEDIVASYAFYHNDYNPDENPRFKSLAPLYEDIPQDQIEEKIEMGGLPPFVQRDWQVFAHRLSEVKYNLKVHYSLEQEIDRIILRVLSIDDVIPACSEMFYDPYVEWLNPEIFEQFVRENVSIEIIGEDSETDYSDLTSGLSWQVYSGGCFANYGPNDDITVCGRHLFNVWLVGFSDTSITVWSMKYVEEPGCGELLPIFQVNA